MKLTRCELIAGEAVRVSRLQKYIGLVQEKDSIPQPTALECIVESLLNLFGIGAEVSGRQDVQRNSRFLGHWKRKVRMDTSWRAELPYLLQT